MAMAKNFDLKIISCDGIKFNGLVESVTVPTLSGEISILANHIPVLSGLKKGTIKILSEGKAVESISISSGFLRFINNQCVVTIEQQLKKAS
jgi:F-type H+-transporting ATPase subunit epsilon